MTYLLKTIGPDFSLYPGAYDKYLINEKECLPDQKPNDLWPALSILCYKFLEHIQSNTLEGKS